MKIAVCEVGREGGREKEHDFVNIAASRSIREVPRKHRDSRVKTTLG